MRESYSDVLKMPCCKRKKGNSSKKVPKLKKNITNKSIAGKESPSLSAQLDSLLRIQDRDEPELKKSKRSLYECRSSSVAVKVNEKPNMSFSTDHIKTESLDDVALTSELSVKSEFLDECYVKTEEESSEPLSGDLISKIEVDTEYDTTLFNRYHANQNSRPDVWNMDEKKVVYEPNFSTSQISTEVNFAASIFDQTGLVADQPLHKRTRITILKEVFSSDSEDTEDSNKEPDSDFENDLSYQQRRELTRQSNPTPGKRKLKNKFSCPACTYCFSNLGSFKRHLLKHGKDNSFECRTCGQKFKTAGAMCAHELTHTLADSVNLELPEEQGHARKYACVACKLTTGSTLQLETHVCFDPREFNHAQYPTSSNQMYQQDSNEQIHSVSENNESPHCTGCKKKFSSKYKLSQHVKSFHTSSLSENITSPLHNQDCSLRGVNKIMCDNSLPDSNDTSPTFPIVVKTECTEIPPSNLEISDSIALKQNTLAASTASRNLEPPFKKKTKKHHCTSCDKVFSNNNYLRRHEKIYHDGIQVFRCDPCHRIWFSVKYFERHQCNKTTQETVSPLPIKPEPTESITQWSQTQNVPVTTREVKCPACPRKMMPSNLALHLRKHKFERSFGCDICVQKFTTAGAMCAHKLSHNNNNNNNIPNEQKTLLKCSVCNLVASTVSELESHTCYNLTKQFKCRYCPKAFYSQSSQNFHTRTHLSNSDNNSSEESGTSIAENQSSCNNNNISTSDFLITDSKPVFSNRNLQHCLYCPLCSRTFAGVVSFKTHIWKHGKRKDFKCRFCNQKFESAGAMCAHELSHKGTSPENERFTETEKRREKLQPSLYECAVCSISTDTILQLETHACFNMIAEFKCPQCPELFLNKQLLNSHVRTHLSKTERQTLRCSFCDNVYACKDALSKHEKVVHKGVQNFLCKLCSLRFLNKQRFENHNCIKRKRTLMKKAECHLCHQILSCAQSLKNHMLRHSGEKPLMCETCGKRFRTSIGLNHHTPTHSDARFHSCHLCHKSFKTANTLRNHVNCVHNKRESTLHCDVCDREISRGNYVRHLRTHTGEKPYQCESCDYSAIQSELLKVHIKVHHSSSSRFDTKKKVNV